MGNEDLMMMMPFFLLVSRCGVSWSTVTWACRVGILHGQIVMTHMLIGRGVLVLGA